MPYPVIRTILLVVIATVYVFAAAVDDDADHNLSGNLISQRMVQKKVPWKASVDKKNDLVPVPDDGIIFEDQKKHLTHEGRILQVKANGFRFRSLYRSAIKWNKHEIPYFFNTNLSKTVKPQLKQAIQYYKKNTCLRFKEIAEHETGNRNYIEIINGDGCSSMIGQPETDERRNQEMTLGDGCEDVSTILHEMGHALGLAHTMKRADRDDYLLINEDNILEEYKGEYEKMELGEGRDYGLPYDYLSIMHYYDARDFAINESVWVMKPKNPLYEYNMGNNFELTFVDLKMLNRFYNCDESCKTKIKCKNGGFQNSNQCDTCVCPVGFGGYNCAVRAGSDDPSTDWGATLKATSKWKTLDANFTTSSSWWIIAQKNKHVEIKFVKVNIDSSFQCRRTGLNVKLENPLLSGFRVCNKFMIPEVKQFKSSKNRAILNVYSNQKKVQHFKIRYRQVK